MPTTIRGQQVRDSEIDTVDLKNSAVTRDKVAISPTGAAMIRKIIQGTGITIQSTGDDSGTGDVTINVVSSTIKSIALENQYYIQTKLSTDYGLPNLNQLEKIPFDTQVLVYDNSTNRYDTSQGLLSIEAKEVWMLECTAMVDGYASYSLVLYNDYSMEVIASSYLTAGSRYNTIHVSSLFVAPASNVKIGVYMHANAAITLKENDVNGYGPATICNFKRIK